MDELEINALEGRIRPRVTWVTFELDQKGSLFIRTLYGLKIVEDPAKAKQIIGLLRELAEFDTNQRGD